MDTNIRGYAEAAADCEQALAATDRLNDSLRTEIASLRGMVARLKRDVEAEQINSGVFVSQAKYWFAKEKMDHPLWLKDAVQVLAQREPF